MRGIICADLHLRADCPRCRIDDDWEATQRKALEFIVMQANSYDCDLYIDGDIFNTATVPMRIITMLIDVLSQLNKRAYFIAGNHDLPYHSVENIANSAIGVLCSAANNNATIKMNPDGMHFGAETECEDEIIYIHSLVFASKKDIPPNCEAMSASDVLKKYPNAKWIFTGDMHKAFHYEKNGRHVVNPGCMLRQAADMIDYKPLCYFVCTDDESVEPIYIPDTTKMVDDAYLRAEEQREERITAFVECIKKNGKITLSIIDNLKNAMKNNKKSLDAPTINMIETLMEEAQ